MTLPEFIHLINLAYEFLKVGIDHDVAEQIFKDVDKDQDGLITYGEYFQLIQQYICISKNEKPPVSEKVEGNVPKGNHKNSKLRKYIWDRLRRLYDAYAQGRSLLANDVELKALLLSITGDLS